MVIIHCELIFGLLRQGLLGELNRIGKRIGHRGEARAVIGFERVDDGPATATAATDQPTLIISLP